jgi:hypothetical protein
MQKHTLLKNVSAPLLWGRLLALPTNNRIGWKGLTGRNFSFKLTDITLAHGVLGENSLHAKVVVVSE